MIVAAMEVEVEEYLARHRGERSDDGRALVVRNGRAQARKLAAHRRCFRRARCDSYSRIRKS